MDNKIFDAITQALAAEGSRRRVLSALAGGVAALAGAATLEAKRGGKGKAKAKGRGRGNGGNGNGNGGGEEKVTLCHLNNGKKGFSLITVGAPAVPAHERHGDVVCTTEDVCSVATGCDAEGLCVFTEAEAGTPCELVGVAGECDNGGNCVTAAEGE